jgi:hypothetical protein
MVLVACFAAQGSRSAPSDDQVDWQCSQFGRHGGVAVVTAFRKVGYQPQILPFDIAIVPQLARKPLDRRQGLRGKDADAPHALALLRTRRERPPPAIIFSTYPAIRLASNFRLGPYDRRHPASTNSRHAAITGSRYSRPNCAILPAAMLVVRDGMTKRASAPLAPASRKVASASANFERG